MPFALLIVGIVLVVSAVRGTYSDLITLVSGEFKGSSASSNFLYWFVAIMIIGLIGYAESLRNFSRAFMGLVIIALLLSNSGFFKTFFANIGTSNLGVTLP